MIHEPIICIHESGCIISNSWDCLHRYALLFSHMIWVWRAMCFSIDGFEIPSLVFLSRHLLSYVRSSTYICPTFILASSLRWLTIFPIFSKQGCLPSCKTWGGTTSRNNIVCTKLIWQQPRKIIMFSILLLILGLQTKLMALFQVFLLQCSQTEASSVGDGRLFIFSDRLEKLWFLFWFASGKSSSDW